MAEGPAGSTKAPEVKRTSKKVVITYDTVTVFRRSSVRLQSKKGQQDKGAESSGPGEKRKQGPSDDDDVEGMLKKTKTQSSE